MRQVLAVEGVKHAAENLPVLGQGGVQHTHPRDEQQPNAQAPACPMQGTATPPAEAEEAKVKSTERVMSDFPETLDDAIKGVAAGPMPESKSQEQQGSPAPQPTIRIETPGDTPAAPAKGLAGMPANPFGTTPHSKM
jgi:hypothetical protein